MTDVFTPSKRSWVMSRIRCVDTKPELMVRRMLHRNGFRFRLHRRDLPGRPDIVLPKYDAVIQVNGCFWHDHRCNGGRRPRSNTGFWNGKIEANIRRDARNLRRLRSMGWRCLTVWECQLKNPTKVEKRLDRFLRKSTRNDAA